MKKFLCVMLFGLLASVSFAQENERRSLIFAGLGMGLDYGGLLGAQLEVVPVKYFGVFGGAGLNMAGLGWNVGGKINVSPDKVIPTSLVAMYGTNGVIKVDDERLSEYEAVSKGLTVGVVFEFKAKRNKLNIGLWVPFRDSEFRDKVQKAKNDPNAKIGVILPIGFSFGYMFGF